MSLDFELILVLATAATGVIWAWDRSRRRRTGEGKHQRVSWWRDMGRSLFPVILIVLIIRSFIVEPFRIPSGSMIPTLLAGDFILVNKFAYGIRLPVVHAGLVPTGQPERGDVMVFRYPEDQSQDYIKRLIGLPGDRIRYAGKKLYINGELMPQDILGSYGPAERAQLRTEQLDGLEHRILLHASAPATSFNTVVPEGEYFVMGDNRDRSSDSRYWGTVPQENLVGEAFLIWMSWNMEDPGVNWGRIGNIIE